MIVKIYDKVLFVLGLAVLGASYYFYGSLSPDSGGPSVIITKPRDYEIATFTPPTLEQVKWADAKAQPAGPKWLYDLFTPPLVFLNPKDSSLTPEPPKLQLDTDAVGKIGFPFILVDITRDLYRIQLMGYFGQAPDYRVNLEDRDSGMPLIGRAGTRFERSKVELKSFNVERRTVDQGGTPLVEEIATAVIVDMDTGEEITLRQPGPPHYLPTPKAEFRTRDEVPVNFILRAGESKKFGDYNFAIRELSLDPKKAVVVREASGDIPEIVRDFEPATKEELEAPQLPTIQGGAPSNAPFMDQPNPFGEPQARPGQRPPPAPRRN